MRKYPKWANLKNKVAKPESKDDRPQGQKAAKDADKNKSSLVVVQQDIADSLRKKNDLLENHLKMLDNEQKWTMFSSCPPNSDDSEMCEKALSKMRKKAFSELENI